MIKRNPIILVVYILLLNYGSLWAQNEKTIDLGNQFGWRDIEIRRAVTEIAGVRPNSVLTVSSSTSTTISQTAGYLSAQGVWGNFFPLDESALDLSISFDNRNPYNYSDDINRYRVSVNNVESVSRLQARAGDGAVLFRNNGHVRIEPADRRALFAPNARIGDFSIEFWVYPQNMDNGEEILVWSSVLDNSAVQRIQCISSRNRLKWSFQNFFTSVRDNNSSFINLEFESRTPVLPGTWSHHLIRFDASTGLLEYVVNGVSEAIVYSTNAGRERFSSDVYLPLTGRNGSFILGNRFSGIIDEFKIHSACIGRNTIQRYPAPGGRFETRAIDLGYKNSGVLRVNAGGGRYSNNNRSLLNEYRENGRFRFPCDSEMAFYIRSNDNAYLLNESSWHLFIPGTDIKDVRGRFVQIAVDFYPSKDGETAPYLSNISIVYLPGEPPLPPRNVQAIAVDGGVQLRWRNSPSPDAAGYLIYYSSVRDDLFGADALSGISPINAGNRNSFIVEGLENGVLYYFRVASYDEYSTGEFSNEVTARPIAGLRFGE